jgi:soluble lytic murein transglycosylase-like protein
LPESLPEPLPDPAHHHPLPDALRNWQVLEIDGEATPVVTAARPGDVVSDLGALGSLPEDVRDLQIEDRPDELIVAALDNRRRAVECGATVTFAVSILNNGPRAALFQVQVEGWLDPRWMGDVTSAVLLEPGARATLRLPISPPRRAESEAGDYHFAVCVRSPEHPGRTARVGALLTVLPFDVVDMRFLDGPEPAATWFNRSAAMPLVVTNRGNRAVELALHGTCSPPACRLAFAARSGEGGVPTVTLQPGQAVNVGLRAEAERLPLVGLHDRLVGVQVDARLAGVPQRPLAARARTELQARPLVGPWHFVIAGGLAAAAAVGLLLFVALLYFLTQRSTLLYAPPGPDPAAPAAAAMAAPPVIIVNLNQPAAAPVLGSGPAPAGAANAPGAIISDFTAGASPDPSLPLVLPDQVSSPGSPAPSAISPGAAGTTGGAPSPALALNPAPAGGIESAGSAGPTRAQTYGEMFQEIGSRFDIDWRMLAAQAYIESGFDSLALSDAGAMGLMQVLPNTWREWAQPVEVSDPFDAYSNVLVAAVYLDHLRGRLALQGYPDTEWMLVAYNWGPDNLNDFLAGGGTWDTLPQARRQYATEVLRIAKTIP